MSIQVDASRSNSQDPVIQHEKEIPTSSIVVLAIRVILGVGSLVAGITLLALSFSVPNPLFFGFGISLIVGGSLSLIASGIALHCLFKNNE